MTQTLPSNETFTGYPTVDDIDDYFTLVGKPDWLSLSLADKGAARARACLAFETIEWNGDRAVETQPWAWPRINITCNGVTAEADYIPAPIVQAFSELAFVLSSDANLLTDQTPATPRWIQREKLDVLEVEYQMLMAGPAKVGSNYPLVVQKFPWLKDMLKCWAKVTGSQIRLYRN